MLRSLRVPRGIYREEKLPPAKVSGNILLIGTANGGSLFGKELICLTYFGHPTEPASTVSPDLYFFRIKGFELARPPSARGQYDTEQP